MDYLWLNTKLLQKKHWKQLWKIFEDHIEKASGGAKELMESYQDAKYIAGDVILDAHSETRNELEQKLQVQRYASSKRY